MTKDQEREKSVQATIARGRALVREARSLVESTRRRFAELGIDPEAEYESLKSTGGEAAVIKAQAEVQSLMDGIEDEMQRDAMHATTNALVPMRARFNRV